MSDSDRQSIKDFLLEVEVHAGALRTRLIEVGAMFAKLDPEDRIRASKDAEFCTALGAVHAYISMFSAQYLLAGLLEPVVKVVLKESPLMGPDKLADALADGMARAAVSCSCGACAACELREGRGLEVATAELRARLRATVGVVQMAQAHGQQKRPS